MSDKQNQTLGEVVRNARVGVGRGLRELAKDLDIAPSYLSDIENDRRIPAEELLRKIAQILSLDFEELMALAGRFGESFERYVRRHPTAGSLFRKISECNLDDEALRKLNQQIDRMGHDQQKDDKR